MTHKDKMAQFSIDKPAAKNTRKNWVDNIISFKVMVWVWIALGVLAAADLISG